MKRNEMRTLSLSFATAQDFLARTLTHFQSGGLFVASSRSVAEKERVMLDITIRSTMGRYCFQAGVAKKDAEFLDGGRRITGMELEFLTVDQVLIDAMMRDLESSYGTFRARQKERIVVPMDVQITTGDITSVAAVRDFGPGGVFCDDVAGVLRGDTVKLRLMSAEHDLDVRAIGEVTWAGEKDGAFGLGVSFVFASRAEERAWAGTYRRIARRQKRARTEQVRAQFEAALTA